MVEILSKESFDQQAMQSNKVQKMKRVATKQGQSIYKSIMRREGKEGRKERKKERIDANVFQNWVYLQEGGWRLVWQIQVGLEFYVVNLLVHIDNSTRAIVHNLFWATRKQARRNPKTQWQPKLSLSIKEHTYIRTYIHTHLEAQFISNPQDK